MSRIENKWEIFKNEAIGPDAPPIQYKEMKRAFYAGAITMFNQMVSPTVTCVNDEQSEAVLTSLQDECIDFYKLVLEGKA